MGRTVVFEAPGVVGLSSYEESELGRGQVRLETLYSGISAGTELTAYRGSNPYLSKRWDASQRLFVAATTSSLAYPVAGWGYEEVGRVAEIGPGVASVGIGDVVWGAWGHRSTHVITEDEAVRHGLDSGVDPINGVFSQIGAIALNGVLDANIHVGETAAVFGQGTPGLIAMQLARLSGADVIAIDRIPKRLALSEQLGADLVIDGTSDDAAAVIKRRTANRGADVSIEFTGSYGGLNDAIRATAYNSRVVACGFFQGGGGGLFLGEEFHHNRIEVVCSQISGVGTHVGHRWDEERLRATVMELQARGKVRFEPLVSHIIPVEDAAEGFRLAGESPQDAIQVVLKF